MCADRELLVIDAADALGASGCRDGKINIKLRVVPVNFDAIGPNICTPSDKETKSKSGETCTLNVGSWSDYDKTAGRLMCAARGANSTCTFDAAAARRYRGRVMAMPISALTF